MVPVMDSNRVPLMPCTEKRARMLQEKGMAKGYWYKGIFCLILQREPFERSYQEVVVGIDPGSKREGYTVTARKRVVLNILTDTPSCVKDKVATRAMLRRNRRYRKAPYRKCRSHRKGRVIPPSTRARWGAKVRIVMALQKVLPLTSANVEDVCAVTKKGARRWNTSFSPLEVGKKWFYQELTEMGLTLVLTQGFDTKAHRDKMGHKKSKEKLKDIWEAHCVDSHSLCEMVFGRRIKVSKKMYRIGFFNWPRRNLHVQLPAKGGVRKPYGGTMSMGISKGTLVRHKDAKYDRAYIGGSSKGRLSLQCKITKKRLTTAMKKENIVPIKKLSWLTRII